MTTRVKWAAELKHVSEVSLLGSADLRYWQDRLATEDFHPVGHDGRVPVMIVTAEGKFMGLRFRELSISIVLNVSGDSPIATTCYLASAFNSNRLFAFCERNLFSTPYEHANVRLEPRIPVTVHVVQHGHTVYHAAMQRGAIPDTRTPSHEGEDTWEARILLPYAAHSKGQHGKMFFARIRGETRTFPFLVGEDTIAIQPRLETDPFRALLDSQFVPQQWVIRTNATHAKSKTYARNRFARC